MYGSRSGEDSMGETQMSIKDRYLAYAAAFEESYEDDDWSRLAQYFTPDAVYEGEPEARDRQAVLDRLRNAVSDFDRRMDSRTINFGEPVEEGDVVTVGWRVAYTKNGCPDLVITGKEIALFEGDQIKNLRDDFDDGVAAAMSDWMTEYGAQL